MVSSPGAFNTIRIELSPLTALVMFAVAICDLVACFPSDRYRGWGDAHVCIHIFLNAFMFAYLLTLVIRCVRHWLLEKLKK